MNKFRFLFCVFIISSAPSFAQTEQAYTPPPMFGTPVVTPQAATVLTPVTTPAPAPIVTPQITPTPAPKTKPVIQPQQPTKSARAEDLLNHPVTAAPSPNTIDPLLASQIAKSKMPQPKDGEIVDDTGVDPSKVRYPNGKPSIPKAKPIVEDAPKKTEKPKVKSKAITTEQQKMPVVTTKKVEELSLAPMKDVKNSSAPVSTKPKIPAPATIPSTKQSLSFTVGVGDLTPAHKSSLGGIVDGLKAKPSARVQILSYATPANATGSLSARRVSLTRGLAIRTYLLSQGIDGGRIDVRALGNETAGKTKLDQADIVIME